MGSVVAMNAATPVDGLKVTCPGTGPKGPESVKFEVVTEPGALPLLKVTVIGATSDVQFPLGAGVTDAIAVGNGAGGGNWAGPGPLGLLLLEEVMLQPAIIRATAASTSRKRPEHKKTRNLVEGIGAYGGELSKRCRRETGLLSCRKP